MELNESNEFVELEEDINEQEGISRKREEKRNLKLLFSVYNVQYTVILRYSNSFKPLYNTNFVILYIDSGPGRAEQKDLWAGSDISARLPTLVGF